MSSDECHRTLLVISQHWFRYWLGAVRQQAITWTSVDQDLQRHMASLGSNVLNNMRNRSMKCVNRECKWTRFKSNDAWILPKISIGHFAGGISNYIYEYISLYVTQFSLRLDSKCAILMDWRRTVDELLQDPRVNKLTDPYMRHYGLVMQQNFAIWETNFHMRLPESYL